MIEPRPLVFYAGGFAAVGGVENFTSDLLLALRSRGVPVRLVCWGGDGQALRALRGAGVGVHRSPWRWGCRWGWPDRILARQWKQGGERATLMVYSKTFHAETHAELKKFNSGGASVLITPYRPLEFWGDQPPEEVGKLLAMFDSIVVQAQAFEDDLRRLGYRGQVHVLPYVPPPRALPVAFPTEGPLKIGYLGRLARQKNLEYLLEAFALLLASREADARPMLLEVLGDGPERNRLKRTARRLSIGSCVYFRGDVPRSDVPKAIDSCHMFAITSRSEGQCLAALEILSRGRPLVATPVGALPEILDSDKAGALAPLRDARAYAKAMAALVRRIDAGELLPCDVTEYYADRYPREKIIDQYLQVFASWTQRASPGARMVSSGT